MNIFLVLSWALYDLANQFFALNIVSLYFPRWITIEKGLPEIFYAGAFGASMLLVAVFAPVLGAFSDEKGRRKELFAALTLISVIFTIALGLTEHIFLGLIFFIVANFGCQEAVIFYNALMAEIAPKDRIGFVSGLGRMFGYSGALLALFLSKPIIIKLGYHATFLLTGILFLVFAAPCLLFVKGHAVKKKLEILNIFKRQNIALVFKQLKKTLFHDEAFGSLRKFLAAFFFLLCVVNTLILFMSVYATKVFGLSDIEIINLIAFSAFFAIGGSIFLGYFCDMAGCTKSVKVVFMLWMATLLAGGLLRPPLHWLAGALAGAALGSTWVTARAMVIQLVPPERLGEAFGVFNMVSYLSGLLGPLFWGIALICLSPLEALGYRLAFLTLMLFVAIGFFYFLKVPRCGKII